MLEVCRYPGGGPRLELHMNASGPSRLLGCWTQPLMWLQKALQSPRIFSVKCTLPVRALDVIRNLVKLSFETAPCEARVKRSCRNALHALLHGCEMKGWSTTSVISRRSSARRSVPVEALLLMRTSSHIS